MGITEDDIPTRRIQKISWLPPVPRAEDLPIDGVLDGTMCLVEGRDGEGEEEVWEFEGGSWRQIDTL